MSDLQSQFQLFLQFQKFLQQQSSQPNPQSQPPNLPQPQPIFPQQEDNQSNPYQSKNSFYSNAFSQSYFRVPSVDDGKEITFNTMPLIEHIDLNVFKTQPCQIQQQHSIKQCVYYHNSNDRRRPGNFYSSEMCDNPTKCSDQCQKSHNKVEKLYRPDKYKTKFCPQYPHNCHKCEYGIFCPYAHSETDIMAELIHNLDFDEDFYLFHFKTVWCPYNYINHDQISCVYSHTLLDYRRKPHVYNYEAQPCYYWKNDEMIEEYENVCPYKYQCSRSHGLVELNFHPKYYKTQPCQFNNCPKGQICPFYHNEQDQKQIPQNVSNSIFKFMPRNRIVEGTFKLKQQQQQQQMLAQQIPFIPQRGMKQQMKLPELSSSLQLPPYQQQIQTQQRMASSMKIVDIQQKDEQQVDWLTEEFEKLMNQPGIYQADSDQEGE